MRTQRPWGLPADGSGNLQTLSPISLNSLQQIIMSDVEHSSPPCEGGAQREGFLGTGVGGCCGGTSRALRISNHASGLHEGWGSA